jgi:plastocyanin
MRMWGLSLAAIAVVVVAACGGGGDSGGTGPGTPTGPGTNPSTNPNTVTLVDSSFAPATINVKPGTTVTWQWSACTDTTGGYGGYGSGTACITHQIAFDDGSGTQSPMQAQGSFNRTFAAAGTFKYHCTVHGSYMSGQVVVQ